MASFDTAQLISLKAQFTDVNGAAIDPSTVTVKVVDAAGNVTTPTAVRDSTGFWHALVDLTGATPGTWWFRFVGTGVCQAVEQASFYVEPSI